MDGVKERPILFSAPMVRSLLNCTKSQTRRVVKGLQWIADTAPGIEPYWFFPDHLRSKNSGGGRIGPHHAVCCPYGQPGDRLWVRETWQGPLLDGDTMENEYRGSPDDFHKPEYCVYAADGGSPPEFVTLDDELVCRWRPSIHMPRWASRINLEITGVRVERLNDISEADAIAEGIQRVGDGWQRFHVDPDAEIGQAFTRNPVLAYRGLWEQINGPGSWDANPWVWVVEFKRVTA